MRAPVPYSVVEDWVAKTRHLPAATADRKVSEHLARLCDSRVFGVWARVASKWPPHEVEPFLRHAIRIAYLESTWEQSIAGIFTAIGFDHVPHLPKEVWEAGVLTPQVMEAIADAAIESSPGRRLLGQWRRALVLLTRTDLASVIDERERNTSATGARAPGPKPAPSRPLPPVAPPPQPKPVLPRVPPQPPASTVPASETPQTKQQKTRTALQPVAAIVVRSGESKDVETYLAAASLRDLKVETVFLATALTYRPQWRLLFEQPVSVKVGARRRSLSAVTAMMRGDSIALRFHPADGPALPSTVVIVDFRQRTYVSGDVSHLAVVLLDLLFAHEGRLTASQALGDWKLAAAWLASHGQEPAAVYRLSDRPRWVDGGVSGNLTASGASKARRPHDVRGYHQTRGGKTLRVGPYRRSS